MGNKSSYETSLSYFDAMRSKIGNELACTMQSGAFSAWVDACIERTLMPEEVRRQLTGYDYTDFADRWSAMLILQKNGITITQ